MASNASASPMASAAVVDAVGVMLKGHASRSTAVLITRCGGASQGRPGPSRSRRSKNAPRSSKRPENFFQLFRLTGIRERHHRVARQHHAHVAVHAFGGMDEIRPGCPSKRAWRPIFARSAPISRCPSPPPDPGPTPAVRPLGRKPRPYDGPGRPPPGPRPRSVCRARANQ